MVDFVRVEGRDVSMALDGARRSNGDEWGESRPSPSGETNRRCLICLLVSSLTIHDYDCICVEILDGFRPRPKIVAWARENVARGVLGTPCL